VLWDGGMSGRSISSGAGLSRGGRAQQQQQQQQQLQEEDPSLQSVLVRFARHA